MESHQPQKPSDDFLTWYRNSCTSGVSSLSKALSLFIELPPDKQEQLLDEYRKMCEITKKPTKPLSKFGGCTLD